MSLNKTITNGLELTSSGVGIATSGVTLARMANLAAGTIIGRQVGAGTGVPVALTGAEAAQVVQQGLWTQVEETGAGAFADYAVSSFPHHIKATNSAGEFNGVSVTNATLGTFLLFSHQGSGYTQLTHNSTSSLANRLFNGRQGKNIRLYDNESAIYAWVDTSTAGGTFNRWELIYPQPPYAQASDSAAGDVVAHNGTNYVVVAGGNSADVVLRGNATFGTVSTAAIADAAVTVAKIAVADANGHAAVLSKRVAFSATGATGTLVDVNVWNADAPFALRIVRATLRVSTAAGTASALRTASGGGGSVVLPDVLSVTQTFSTAATGPVADNAAASATVSANGSLFFNVDRAVAGELLIEFVKV